MGSGFGGSLNTSQLHALIMAVETFGNKMGRHLKETPKP